MLYWKNRHDGYFVLGKEIKNIMIPINNKFSYNFTYFFFLFYQLTLLFPLAPKDLSSFSLWVWRGPFLFYLANMCLVLALLC